MSDAFTFQRIVLLVALFALVFPKATRSWAIEIVLDYTLDDRNAQWFSGTADGVVRREALDTAAAFLSAVVTNDDWNSLGSLNQSISFSDVAASSLYDLDGNLMPGIADSDGEGFAYTFTTTNRSSVATNEYILYVGAFDFDSGTSSHAKGGWSSSNSSRNAAGAAGTEFNTWGGRIYFDTSTSWYTGQNPGVDPTDDYGSQDSNKMPAVDIPTDNWDWSTSSATWKGFDLRSIDSLASGKSDLYAVGLHEMMHAMGATSSNIASFLDVQGGYANGSNVVAEFGGPVPLSSTGGHFASNTQAEVWDSDGIVSEALLDPSSTNGDRKYLTKLDAALLRDLGYDIVSTLTPVSYSAADFDQDGDVDDVDLSTWVTGYGLGATGDANDDGYTTGADWLIWQREYDEHAGNLNGVATIPEPRSLLLSALVLIQILLIRYRAIRRRMLSHRHVHDDSNGA